MHINKDQIKGSRITADQRIQIEINTEHQRSFDVVVAGGGVAGFAAAVSASRAGARTCLIERSQSIGGTATSGSMNLFYTPYSHSRGIVRELVDNLIKEDGAFPGEVIHFDPEICKIKMLEMLEDSNVFLLLDTLVIDVIMKENEIIGLVAANKSGTEIVWAERFIDATGDADISGFAGADLITGRESDHKMRPMTLLFCVGGIDVERMVDYVRSHRENFSPDPNQCRIDIANNDIRVFGFFSLVEKAKRAGDLYEECEYFRIESIFPKKGIGTVNTIRVFDVDGKNVDDIVRAQIVSRKQEMSLLGFMRKYVPGFENTYVISSGQYIGVRDTRRIKGEHSISEEDILKSAGYDDTIAVDYSRQIPGVEGHDPGGKEGSKSDTSIRQDVAVLTRYEIPYRCLIPKGIENLLVSGRCISVSHTASKYTRNMPACMYTGQAAGAAAAFSLKEKCSVRSINIKALCEYLELDCKR